MAQEFTIKSKDIESKINQLLPSQGGFQAGVDFSASTMVIPIVDLTETAEGSSLRQDLQTAQSFTSAEAFNVSNTTTTLINTTGYYSVKGNYNLRTSTLQITGQFQLTDGVSTKVIYGVDTVASISTSRYTNTPFNFVVFLGAGESLVATTNSLALSITGSSRQIADISGNLINP